MLGIVIPAHNESAHIEACVSAALRSANHAHRLGEAARVIVVADHCTDNTAQLAAQSGAQVLRIDARNVGVARAAGAACALEAGARWLAFTDADSLVAEDWLVRQLECNADAVCGVVSVRDWSPHLAAVREHFARNYTDADGHRHIHGANLGVSARAYTRVGGFAPMEADEDVMLVEALIADGARIAWSAAPRVVTSARTDFRAKKGFGATLLDVSKRYWLAGESDEPMAA